MSHATFEPIFSPGNERTICRRYEIFYEYLREIARPLTRLEQRAFLHLLDLTEDSAHTEDCVCAEFMPKIVQALEPEPVNGAVAERDLEGQTYASQRFHTERYGKDQGITVSQRTKKEHTAELTKTAKGLLADFETVLRELMRRENSHESVRKMLSVEFPQLLELASVGRRKVAKQASRTPAWRQVQQKLEEQRRRAGKEMHALAHTLTRWGISCIQ